MSLKRTTLTEIQKRELCIYARDNKRTRSHPNSKRHKSVTYPELELALKEFVLNYQHRTVLSDAILIEKAKMIAEGLGEASSADETAIANALPLLRELCSNYPPERIYNMDETGLFYRLEPDRTLATKHLAGRKVNRERLSIALCANADGSHKLNPLIIGKFERPRCFKNIRIQAMPMTYRHNAKAWMITSLFQEWIREFDCQVGLKHQGQRVLLLLDNCSSHKLGEITLRYTDVHFLPPNTTSKIQPMDAGVIMSFKRYYRQFHVRLCIIMRFACACIYSSHSNLTIILKFDAAIRRDR
ncbi:unnamed protein product [Rhizophagus irregularis]|nr:unnamed protein product [Rhizophagus irregularis]